MSHFYYKEASVFRFEGIYEDNNLKTKILYNLALLKPHETYKSIYISYSYFL